MGFSMSGTPFCLQDQKEYKALTMDQWQGFLRFCEEVRA
jgi:hypothetical protein